MPVRVLGAVALGGALGSLARFGLSVAFPHPPGGFAVSTVLVNVTGCLCIGVLYTVTANPLWRAFLGVGVLGGYTTYSTAVLDALQSARTGHWLTAFGYTFGTLAACLLAVAAGMRLAPVLRPTRSGEE
ncbi:CrcB family protein [Amycolatopsis sp. YIM 10]|uniref:fluoride efflux transporter FluC n=1 Tax=Amycolatopsis sp. YIM 10 TaxID=2653857 RepID=UPI0012A81246|nr:CrcB family protein [Amycolatopsis sp. YIM 10]QFU91322.1 camphor resistance protein CrcB [Amycolatopsis sp. YIM 10]